MLKEFREFINRGNVVDLSVGVIVGGAFGKIVSSLVDNVLMPIIGIVIGGIDFSNLSITYKDANIAYGLFLQNVIDFLIIAFCIFLLVKFLNNITRKKSTEEKPTEPVAPKPSEEVLLLTEIRDLLKKETKTTKNSKTKKS